MPLKNRCVSTPASVRAFCSGPQPDTAHSLTAWRAPPDLLQLLGTDMLPRRERTRVLLQQVTRDFERFPGDVGSTEVQVRPVSSSPALPAPFDGPGCERQRATHRHGPAVAVPLAGHARSRAGHCGPPGHVSRCLS